MQEGGSTGRADKIRAGQLRGRLGCHPLRQQLWENSLSRLGKGPCVVLRLKVVCPAHLLLQTECLLLLLISSSPPRSREYTGQIRTFYLLCRTQV